jgi:Ca-activated chloride channel homolog
VDSEVPFVSVIGFIWPAMLLGLLILPALAGAYVRLLRRQVRVSVTFPRVDVLGAAMERRRTVWRHIPAAVFLLGIAMLMLATARPVIPLRTRRRPVRDHVVDRRKRQHAQDVEPSRLEAAKYAAKTFIATLPRRIRVGLVTFTGYATVHVLPIEMDILLDCHSSCPRPKIGSSPSTRPSSR